MKIESIILFIFFNDKYYDINVCFYTVEELLLKLDYYDKDIYSIETSIYDVDLKYMIDLPKNLIPKKNKSFNKIL